MSKKSKTLGVLVGAFSWDGQTFEKCNAAMPPINIANKKNFLRSVSHLFDASMKTGVCFQITFIEGIECLGPIKKRRKKRMSK